MHSVILEININIGDDGGIYAEIIDNRAFQGFGLVELLSFVEDIGSTPVLVVYAGYSLDRQAVSQDQIQIYVDEVVRELDILTASASDNKMDALRAYLSCSEPFDIRYVEIGNEEFFNPSPSSYGYRWFAFHSGLSQKYPNITFIATTTQSIETSPAVDDHNYEVPLFFINNFCSYKKVPRSDPKVLAGEFSVTNDDDSKLNNPFDSG
ncbi:unnamed protein product [Rotaria magnacalcarata]|uniref:Alpha-L-arabinofuranosidase 1 catalytic domain-containing protein n=1 Tax=Rotaria magnacalcarata TaxID=392030 RepID=A0A8S2TDW4_9BILA|nr:unnamed protein product [Rotaria magnacalcarata]